MVSPLSYTVETGQKAPGGPFLGYASAPCDGKDCKTKLKVWLGKSNNPDAVMFKARRMGWHFDSWKCGRNFCPDCVQARKLKARGDSGKKATPPPLDHATVKSLSRSAQNLCGMLKPGMPPPAKEREPDTSDIPEVKPAWLESARLVSPITIDPPYHQETTLNATIKPTGADHGTPRALTVEERLAVRNLLDKHFDDAAGRFIEGCSDQHIADKVKVPRGAVVALREVAYGPLKGNDELDAVKATLAVVEGKLKAAERILEAAKAGAEAAKDVMDKALARVEEASETMKAVESTMEVARRNIASITSKLGIAA